MSMKAPPSRSSSSSVRYLTVAVLGGITVYLLWKLLFPMSPMERAAASCPLNKKQYNLVQIYKGDKLDLTMFTFDTDSVSKEVLAHGSKNVSRVSLETCMWGCGGIPVHGDTRVWHLNLV